MYFFFFLFFFSCVCVRAFYLSFVHFLHFCHPSSFAIIWENVTSNELCYGIHCGPDQSVDKTSVKEGGNARNLNCLKRMSHSLPTTTTHTLTFNYALFNKIFYDTSGWIVLFITRICGDFFSSNSQYYWFFSYFFIALEIRHFCYRWCWVFYIFIELLYI